MNVVIVLLMEQSLKILRIQLLLIIRESLSFLKGCTCYVAVNIWQGIKNVDKDLVDMGRAFGVSKRKIVWHVYLPSLLPFIFAAVRIGFSVSWKLVVLAEVFGAGEGIGYMIFYWYQMFDMESVLAWVLLFVFIMLILEYGIVRRLERRLLAWRPRAIL